ncbi:MAG: hypothetical protein MI861_24075, partial [Pirellulales bacterium]|nr:hypothetical protein [Pirellulales bacterium]
MPGSVKRSDSRVNQLSLLHVQMEDNEHVLGTLSSVYAHSGSGQNKWRYARGYDGVKQVIANSVGEPAAEVIMNKILPNRNRSSNTRQMRRNTAISKQKLKSLIDETYKTLKDQLDHFDIHDRQRLLKKMFRDPNLRVICEEDVDSLEVAEVLKDPELNALMQAQAQEDGSEHVMEFLRAIDHYDTLVNDAEQHLQRLIKEGGVNDNQ